MRGARHRGEGCARVREKDRYYQGIRQGRHLLVGGCISDKGSGPVSLIGGHSCVACRRHTWQLCVLHGYCNCPIVRYSLPTLTTYWDGWGYDGCSSTAIYIRAVTVSLCACMCVYAWVCLFVCVRCKLIRANVYICRRIYECIRVAHVWPFHLIYYDKASYTQLHRNPHLPSLTSYSSLVACDRCID